MGQALTAQRRRRKLQRSLQKNERFRGWDKASLERLIEVRIRSRARFAQERTELWYKRLLFARMLVQTGRLTDW